MKVGDLFTSWNVYNYQHTLPYENFIKGLSSFKDKSNGLGAENAPPALSRNAALIAGPELAEQQIDKRIASAASSSRVIPDYEGSPSGSDLDPHREAKPKINQASGQPIEGRVASAAISTGVKLPREGKDDKFKRLAADYESHQRMNFKPCELALIAEGFYRNRRHSDIEAMVAGINPNYLPTYAAVYRVHAKSLVFQGRIPEAREVYKKCIALIKNECDYNVCVLDWMEMELTALNLRVVETTLANFTPAFQTVDILRNKLIINQAHFNTALLANTVTKNLSLLPSKQTVTAIGNLERCIQFLLARGEYQAALEIYEKILAEGIPHLSDGEKKAYEKRIMLGIADCYLLMQKLFKADICYNNLKKICSLSQAEEEMRESIFLEMAGNVEASLQAIKKKLFAPGSLLTDKRFESTAYVKICYRYGLFDELLSRQDEITAAFPYLAHFFIKARIARGEAPLELIEKFRPFNKTVGPFICTEALVYLNPCFEHFNPAKARKLLLESIYYTHQYGDAWIELARLEMIERGPNADLSGLENKFIGMPANNGELWYFLGKDYPEAPLLQLRQAVSNLREEMRPLMPVYENAKAGKVGPKTAASLYSSASISYCRAVASGTLVKSISRYQLLDLAKSTWTKK